MPGAHARLPTPTTSSPGRTARAAVGGLVLTLVVLVVAVGVVALRPLAERGEADARQPGAATVGAALVRVGAGAAHVVDARTVLRDWDARRARAWARADPDALRQLYVAGCPAQARDVAMLTRWQERGLRVTGLRTQVLSLAVVSARPRTMVLRVTDRVASAVARGPRTRVRLPRDAAETRRVELAWARGEWRVAAVRLL